MTPGESIRESLLAKTWTQSELAEVLGKPLAALNEIIQGKRRITPDMAIALGRALGSPPEYWMSLDAAHWLAKSEVDGDDVAHRARLFSLAPIKDLQRRGWIQKTESIDELENELKGFFGVDALDIDPVIAASARKTGGHGPFNPSQRAWAFRAKNLARCVRASEYSEASLKVAVKQLKRLTGWPEEIRKVPAILAKAGIRFVIVEPLPHTTMDGVAFRMEDGSPVIAMSLRYNRVDNFWHVLGHEISHIVHNDEPVIDDDAIDKGNEIEQRADRESLATWIDPAEMDSFISRVGPLYSIDKINQFANRLRVHPGIIIGQLQGRGELRFQAFRESLVKIREHIAGVALTDGWGHEVGI